MTLYGSSVNVTTQAQLRVTKKERIRAQAIADYNAALAVGDIDRAAEIAQKHKFSVLDYHLDWNEGGRERWQRAIRRAQTRKDDFLTS